MGEIETALAELLSDRPDITPSLATDVADELVKHPKVQQLIKEQANAQVQQMGAMQTSRSPWTLVFVGVGIGLAVAGAFAAFRGGQE